MNTLREFFYSRTTGPGVWKWDHYFEIYDRHFRRFVDRPVSLLEIGVYSGGSLEMWRAYLGPLARVYGVDIHPDCKAYEKPGVEIFIGDQGDPGFWREFKAAVPPLDVVIDDGSHKARNQIMTLEALLPHINPGGVYLCEDIHGYPDNRFAEYVGILARALNDHRGLETNPEDDARRLVRRPTELQAEIDGIHLYPYVAVVEKRAAPLAEFVAPKRGTEWQPFKP